MIVFYKQHSSHNPIIMLQHQCNCIIEVVLLYNAINNIKTYNVYKSYESIY